MAWLRLPALWWNNSGIHAGRILITLHSAFEAGLGKEEESASGLAFKCDNKRAKANQRAALPRARWPSWPGWSQVLGCPGNSPPPTVDLGACTGQLTSPSRCICGSHPPPPPFFHFFLRFASGRLHVSRPTHLCQVRHLRLDHPESCFPDAPSRCDAWCLGRGGGGWGS